MEWYSPEFFALAAISMCGSVVYSFFRPNPIWHRWCGNILVGTLFGVVVTQAVCWWRSWHDIHLCATVALATGVAGVVCMRTFVEYLEGDFAGQIKGSIGRWLRRVFGIENNPPGGGGESGDTIPPIPPRAHRPDSDPMTMGS